MTQFNIALSPMLPTALLIALAIGAIIVVALSFWTRARGAW